MKLLILVGSILLMTLVSSQLGYNNPNLPRIDAPKVEVAPVNNNTLNVNNSNCWQGDCSGFRNPFNQNLNTTNQPIFAGINTTAKTQADVSVLGNWHCFSFLTIDIGCLTSENGIFQFTTKNNFDLYFTNDDLTSQFNLLDSGRIIARVTNSYIINNVLTAIASFETNSSKTTIYNNFTGSGLINNLTNNLFVGQNTTIKGAYHDWAVINGRINATGVNITSEHQTYNITATTSLDTVYVNTYQRPIRLDVTILTETSSTDRALINLQNNNTQTALSNYASIGILSGSFIDSTAYINWEGTMIVQPSKSWKLESQVSGAGAVTLQNVWVTVI